VRCLSFLAGWEVGKVMRLLGYVWDEHLQWRFWELGYGASKGRGYPFSNPRVFHS
jgi:hypothetical protein